MYKLNCWKNRDKERVWKINQKKKKQTTGVDYDLLLNRNNKKAGEKDQKRMNKNKQTLKCWRKKIPSLKFHFQQNYPSKMMK